MVLALPVGPRLVDDDLFIKRDAGEFGAKSVNALSLDAGFERHLFGRIARIEIFFGKQGKGGGGPAAIGKGDGLR